MTSLPVEPTQKSHGPALGLGFLICKMELVVLLRMEENEHWVKLSINKLRTVPDIQCARMCSLATVINIIMRVAAKYDGSYW